MPETVQCTVCGKTYSAKMRICPHCGNEYRAEPPDIGDTVPVCPVCSCGMVNHSYRGYDIDMCPRCNSIWVDSRDFRKLTSERDVLKDDSIPDEYV